jgi:hypothetical protein
MVGILFLRELIFWCNGAVKGGNLCSEFTMLVSSELYIQFNYKIQQTDLIKVQTSR